MFLSEFIYSPRWKFRLARHLVFWLVFFLHFVLQNLLVGGPGEASKHRSFMQSIVHSFYFMPAYLLSTYLFIEVLLPKLLYIRRYMLFALSGLGIFIFTFAAVYALGALYIHNVSGVAIADVSFAANKYHAFVNGMFFPLMLWSIASGIRFARKWYLQKAANEKLEQQKLATELQLLKTSIHPRFLFHALQTVGNHIESGSRKSPALVLELADLLSYILYEKDDYWVSVQKELEIVKSYINFEREGFGENLVLDVHLPDIPERNLIAPFILLSLTENCFECFVKTGQSKPVLSMNITADSYYHINFRFSAPADCIQDESTWDHINYVRKKLTTQYPGTSTFKLSYDEGFVVFDLKLPIYSEELIGTAGSVITHEEAIV